MQLLPYNNIKTTAWSLCSVDPGGHVRTWPVQVQTRLCKQPLRYIWHSVFPNMAVLFRTGF